MGLRDTAEQLDACRAQSVADEARIAELEQQLDTARRGITEQAARYAASVDDLDARITDRDRQIAELEHDLVRAESALADRLQHDAHTRPTLHTIDADSVASILSGYMPETAAVQAARLIVPLVQSFDGVLLTPEEAALAVRACRHSAESIRAVLDVDPARLHPDVAPYVERLTDLADRLTEETR
jgi:hypothetical protein